MTALLRTPLYAEHLASGARLTDFGGWEMPLHYGSQLDEHHRVRRDAGVFDVSHMLAVDVTGAGATAFLRRLLANDVARLAAPGRALYSCMLREDGGILDDLIVYRTAEGWRIVVNAGTAEKDLAWILAQRDAQVMVQPRRDLAMLALQGPQARARLWAVHPELQAQTRDLAPFQAADALGWFVARTGYTGEDGFEIMLPVGQAPELWRALLQAGAAPCGLGARDTLRLEAGMNLYGQDMDETVTPDECGLAWTVAGRAQREFIGVQGLRQRAPRFQMLGLVLLERGVPRAHQKVRSSEGAGELTSGTFSPTLGRGIALARLPLACASGQRVELDVRGRWLPAQVVKSPFVRNGKSLLPDELAQKTP
jgi:aminomethyltransferase